MKKITLVILMGIILTLSACGGKSNNESTDSTKQDTQVEAPEETSDDAATSENNSSDASTSDNEAESVKNDTKVFSGDSLTEVAMGSENGDSSEKLCSVKMGANYLISGKTMNAQGVKDQIGASVSPQVSDVSLGDSFVAEAVVRAQGEIDDEYVFMISPSSQYNVSMVKEKIPNGYDVNGDGNHAAYITGEGRFDALFIYAINEDWVLVIEYTGDLANRISMEEIGQELYQLVTPVE